VADQAPKAEQKADPARAQYVINLTPEQYESRLKQVEAKDAPPRSQIEMGGSGTATVSFADATGGSVAITATEWSATGPVTVVADETDPASAKITPTGPGPATVTATVQTVNGSAQAHADVMVTEKVGAPVTGVIEITAQPAAPVEPPVEPPPPPPPAA
jgi:hypothetical protein